MRKLRILLVGGATMAIGCLNLVVNLGVPSNLSLLCEIGRSYCHWRFGDQQSVTNEPIENPEADKNIQPMEELIITTHGRPQVGMGVIVEDLPTGHMTYERIHGGIGY